MIIGGNKVQGRTKWRATWPKPFLKFVKKDKKNKQMNVKD